MDKEASACHVELEPLACHKSLQSKSSFFCKCPSLMDLIPKWHCLAFGVLEWPL